MGGIRFKGAMQIKTRRVCWKLNLTNYFIRKLTRSGNTALTNHVTRNLNENLRGTFHIGMHLVNLSFIKLQKPNIKKNFFHLPTILTECQHITFVFYACNTIVILML